MRQARTIGLVLLATLSACKRAHDGNAPDSGAASVPDASAVDPVTGFTIDLPRGWVAAAPSDPETLLDARREAFADESFFVAPRMVVSRNLLADSATLDQVADRTLLELKELADEGKIRIQRTVTGNQQLAGTAFREVELSYAVLGGKAGSDREVTQRNFIALRRSPGGALYAVVIVVTYMGADEPKIGPEVNRLLASLRFEQPATAGLPR